MTLTAPRQALLATAALLAFAPYPVWLVRTWLDLDLEYTLTCLLALPAAAGLAWVSRRRWSRPGPPHPAGWWLLGAALVVHAVALGIGPAALTGLALPLALVGAVAVVRGAEAASELALPASFLVFLLPIPWLLQPTCAIPAQQASAASAFALLLPTGLDVMLQGVYVYTPDYYIRVDDTCSGLHSACALLMFGIVLAQLLPLRVRGRLLLVALVLPVGLLANSSRVAFLLVMGHHFGKTAAVGIAHDLSTAAFFAAAYVLLFGLAKRLAQPEEAEASPANRTQTPQQNASPSRW